jgi:hypothetical protein
MAIKKSQVALHVRVKLNEKFKAKSMSDEYLMKDKVLFIKENSVYNDIKGEYVFVGSMFNSGIAYLDQLDLEFPISDIGKPAPTKLDLKIEDLEKQINSITEELGLNAKCQDFAVNVIQDMDNPKPIEGVLPFDVELKKYRELEEKSKLLKELKELV